MTQAENPYRQDVFLEDLRQQKDRQQKRIWVEHQQMQLISTAPCPATSSTSTRLRANGSVLPIPLLNDGWYYGQDINSDTITFGEEFCVRRVSRNRLHTPCLPPTSSISPR